MPAAENPRWSAPITMWTVTPDGQPRGDVPLSSIEDEARRIRRLDELREANGNSPHPNTEWMYDDPAVPPQPRRKGCRPR